MIGIILLFVGAFAVYLYLSIDDKPKSVTSIAVPATHIVETSHVTHKKGCGCRLCYKNPTDFRDLKKYNWWDFHDSAGERVYAGGTRPLWGLWTNKENLRAPHCLQTSFDWRFNSPCNDPHKMISGIDKTPDFPFPAECDDKGRCRIRGPLEDHIKYH